MERLQKVIAEYGYASRRKAEELIKSRKVKVNGILVTELGTKVSKEDIISIEDNVINKEINYEYYLLNKPRSVISSVSDKEKRTTVVDLIDTKTRIYPVGRLDYDTTGLIILTNDGTLANILMHPSFAIPKTYIAKIRGELTKEEINTLNKGIKIDNRVVNIKKLKIKRKDLEKNTSLVEITIVEGRNHIVKRIFNELGHDVIKLSRTNYAFLNLDGLKSGDYRKLSIKEVKKLYSLK